MTASPPPDEAAGSVSLSGDHRLPARFTGGSAPRPPRRRRRVLGVLLSAAALLVVLAVTQLAANAGYDEAEAVYTDSAAVAAETQSEVRTADADLEETLTAATSMLAAEQQPLPPSKELETTLADAVARGQEVTEAADAPVAADIPAAAAKPIWFWELFGETAALQEQRDDVDRLTDDLRATSADIVEAGADVTDAGIAVLGAVGQAASAFETAHVSARNDAIITLRDAATEASTITTIDDTAATAYTALQDAAAQVVATETAELAEKDGPLRGARLEIEAFARSLAPGVLLEFDWAPIVNGAGNNGSMGGYTTWWWDDPGRAIIELSDSVAEQWPAERSKALVAHEVGHAISVKCEDMYDASTQDSIEKWATAWAISMGFSHDANGVWAYGYPPQSYIDAAAGCR